MDAPVGLEQLVERLADDLWVGELLVKFEGGCIRSAERTPRLEGTYLAGDLTTPAKAVGRVRAMRDPKFYGRARFEFEGGLVCVTVTESIRVK